VRRVQNAYSGSTLARSNPRAGGGGLQYRVAVIISFDNDPSATESEHSFATDLLYFLAARVSLCPVRPVPPGGGSQAGGGPGPGPRLGTSRPGTACPCLGLLKNAVMADAIPLVGLV
jgi:hypothetical protein